MKIRLQEGCLLLEANHFTEVIEVSPTKIIWEEACGHPSEATTFPIEIEGWRFGAVTATPPIPEGKQSGTLMVENDQLVFQSSAGVKHVFV